MLLFMYANAPNPITNMTNTTANAMMIAVSVVDVVLVDVAAGAVEPVGLIGLNTGW